MPAGLDGNPEPVQSVARHALLGRLAREIGGTRPGDRICAAVDGAPGSGKSTLANELATRIERAGRPVVRSATDAFHRPRAERYRRGRLSPEGYYRDSHDLVSIRRALLEPFLAGRPVRLAAFDGPSDRPVDAPPRTPPAGPVLLFDGLFLHRPELRGFWNHSVFLRAPRRLGRMRADASDRLPAGQFAGFVRRYVVG